MRSQFDQQPDRGHGDDPRRARRLTTPRRTEGYRRSAEAAYGWFLGDERCRLTLADVVTGGCHDGLSDDHVNENQGAESTSMWLTALETIRLLRTRAMAGQVRQPNRGAPVLVELRA